MALICSGIRWARVLGALLCVIAAWTAAWPTAAATEARRIRYERAMFVLSESPDPPDAAAAWTEVALPHDWRTLPRKTRQTGWYHVEFMLAEVPPGGRTVYVRHLRSNSLEIYVNGIRIARSGDLHGPGVQPYGFHLDAYAPPALLREGVNIVHFRMTGASMARALHGLGRVHVGSAREMARLRRGDWELTGGSLRLAFAAALSAGLITLFLWIARRGDRVMFWYAIACLTWAAANFVSFFLRELAPAWVQIVANAYVRFGMSVPAFVLVLRLVERRSPRLELVLWLHLVLALSAPFWTPALPAAARDHWLTTVWWPTSAALLLFVGAWVLLCRPHGARRWPLYLECLALIAMGGFLLEDLLHHLGWIDLEPHIVRHYHVPVLIVAIGAAIFERHVAAVWRMQRSNLELERRVGEATREIEANHAQMRQAEKQHALAAERQRILGDMHDGLGASLVALLRHVQSSGLDRFGIERRVKEALQEMRIAIDALQPREGDLGTVLGNLRYRLDDSISASGIALEWQIEELPGLDELPPSAVFAVQRILLEAITNALKHSAASTLRVAARPCGDGRIEVLVEDDGIGSDPEMRGRGIGLASMRSRAAQLGADLDIVSRPGAGTSIRLVLNAVDHTTWTPAAAAASGC